MKIDAPIVKFILITMVNWITCSLIWKDVMMQTPKSNSSVTVRIKSGNFSPQVFIFWVK